MNRLLAAFGILVIGAAGIFYLYKLYRGVGVNTKPSAERFLTISGSSSGLGLMSQVITAFEKKYPGTKVKILPGTETSDGVNGVGQGQLDIGLAARPLKKEEAEKYPNIEVLTFAKDAMVLAVNQNVTVNNLTKDQVVKIHSGQITDWSQVGGQGGKIVVLDREESESSKGILRKYIIGADLKITKNAIIMHSGDSMNKAIGEMENSIGQTSLGVIKMENLEIKPLSIDNIAPSASTISSGDYKMVREYGIVVSRGKLAGAVKDFVDFIFRSEAGRILAGNEIVPVPR